MGWLLHFLLECRSEKKTLFLSSVVNGHGVTDPVGNFTAGKRGVQT